MERKGRALGCRRGEGEKMNKQQEGEEKKDWALMRGGIGIRIRGKREGRTQTR